MTSHSSGFDESTNRMLREARAELARLEDENRLVHAELDVILSSTSRRALLRTQRLAGALATPLFHPLWSARVGVRRIGRGTPFRVPLDAWRDLRFHRIRLQQLSPVQRTAASEDPGAAIRWIGPMTIAGERHEALFCQPGSSVTFRTLAAAGARLVSRCGIAPDQWERNRAGAIFRLAVSGRNGWSVTRDIHLKPHRRWQDRRWVSVHVSVPAEAAGEVTIVLSVDVPPGPRESIAALWGDPVLEWPRAAADQRRLVRGFVGGARAAGLGAAFNQVRQRRRVDDEQAAYVTWLRAHALDAERLAELGRTVTALPWQPRISVIVPVYNTPPDLLRSCVESVRRQVYRKWELCIADDASSAETTRAALREFEGDERIKITRSSVNRHISIASNAALALAAGDFVAFLDHDDELPPEALAEVVRYLNDHPDADLIYSDEDKLDAMGVRCDPAFKPAWSPELFLTCMYTCHLMVVRRQLVEDVGGFRAGYEGAQDYDLVLRLMERTTRIHHVPKVLYHWRKIPQSTASAGSAKPWALDAGRRALEDYARRNGLDAEVLPGGASGLYRLRRRIRGEPTVSIVIPTTGVAGLNDGRGEDLLVRCLRSVRLNTTWRRYEIVLAIDQEPRPEVTEALAGTRHHVFRYARSGAFNFSRKVNEAVRQASGDHIVLFNDDLEVISPDWLNAMLEFSQEPEVGAVGAKLFYPDGRLQHVGMLMGVAGVAAHAYHQHPGAAPGYMSANICVRNCSAVTGACMMVRQEVWREMEGFNEELAVDFNDVDFCLRLRLAGYRIVYTPYAQLYHHESASFGTRVQSPAELARMREIWGDAVLSDPYYNPNLSPDTPDYRLRRA